MAERWPDGERIPHDPRARIGVFHEVPPDRLDAVLRDGLRCDGSGEKTGGAEATTDEFLDERVPHIHAAVGLARGRVVYAYLPVGRCLVDIDTGALVEVGEFTSRREQVLIRMAVERTRCFVSDLDAYDALKEELDSAQVTPDLGRRADEYWARVTPLNYYVPGRFRRPEVMVVGDIAASAVSVAMPQPWQAARRFI